MFDKKTLHGAYFALAAYVSWGFIPVYFKLIGEVSPWEILGHRVIWSLVLLLGILAATNQLRALKVEMRVIRRLIFTSILLSINWLVFIYAILNNNIVETSLGYFINPLVSVFLGMVFLSERLRPLQWVAVSIASAGIAFQLFYYGEVPLIALTLAFSFGFYGLIRKNLNLPSVVGLTLETMVMLPFAIVGLAWLQGTGQLDFGNTDTRTTLLLTLGGVVTSFPLLCFAAAVTRLSLTTIGMFQYLAPSLSLILAVVIYNEPFGIDRVITFSCIWTALIIFTFEAFYHHRKMNRQGTEGI
jgi:chloramphenicol-sensitive protein RarD